MHLQKIDSSYPIDKILPFCKESIDDERPGARNMSPEDWARNPSSFLYLLYIEKRYDGPGNGYFIHERDGKILCGGGFSVSDIDDRMTHLSSRSYTIPGIRLPRVHGAIHDLSIDLSIEAGRAGAFSSLNEYNAHKIPGYIDINNPANHPNYFVEDSKHYAKPGVRIHPDMKMLGPVKIRDSKQWIAYMIWDKSHEAKFLETMENLTWK